MHSTEIIPSEFKQKIIDDIILPQLESKIRYAISTETFWSTVSSISWAMSTVFLLISAVFAFSDTSYPDLPMGFIAGIMIVFGTILKEFTTFAVNQDHIKNIEINDILRNLDIDFSITDSSTLYSDDSKPDKRPKSYSNRNSNKKTSQKINLKKLDTVLNQVQGLKKAQNNLTRILETPIDTLPPNITNLTENSMV